MAKAKKVVRPEVITGVTLELSEDEAGVLREVGHHVAGNPQGPRGAMDTICEALRAIGIQRCGGGTGRTDFGARASHAPERF